MDMDEIVEAVARAMCTADGFTWENQFSFMTSASGDDSPESYLHSARVAIEAHLSALSARGLAVVNAAGMPDDEMDVWARILPHPQAGTSDLRYLHSLAVFRRLKPLPAARPSLKEGT